MRRTALTFLGILELVVASVILVLAFQLPNADSIGRGFERVRAVTAGATMQVHLLREQVEELRQQDFHKAAKQLRANAHAVASTLQNGQLDFSAIESLGVALGDVARGLEVWASTMDVERLKKLGEGLAAAADYLEHNVVAQAAKVADGLEESVAALEKDAKRLAVVLRAAPPDLKALAALHDGLGRFDAGLEAMGRVLKFERLGAMRDGFAGMETSLGATAEQVEKLSAYSYPVVKWNGWRGPDVDMKPFWGDGPKVAEGLRKAVTGVRAANKQLEDLDKELPTLRASLDESRQAIARTRDGLGATLKNQGDAEALLKALPERSAALADTLPAIGRSFAQMVRKTESLRDAAASLRHVRKLVDGASSHWPDLSAAMTRSAAVLFGAQKQLQQALAQREQYEQAVQNSAQLAKVSADLLPVLTDRLDVRLGQQELSLERMGQGLTEVNAALPEVQQAAVGLTGTFRWLLWLIAALLGVHGLVVVASNLGGRPAAALTV